MDKKCGKIFCLFGDFYFKTEHHISNKWNIQQTNMPNQTYNKNMHQLNLKQWQVTTFIYEVMKSSVRWRHRSDNRTN